MGRETSTASRWLGGGTSASHPGGAEGSLMGFTLPTQRLRKQLRWKWPSFDKGETTEHFKAARLQASPQKKTLRERYVACHKALKRPRSKTFDKSVISVSCLFSYCVILTQPLCVCSTKIVPLCVHYVRRLSKNQYSTSN